MPCRAVIGQEAGVADTMEAGWQDMDEEAADELCCGQAHDLHSVAAFYPIVFPSKGYSLCVDADEAALSR